MKHVLAMILGFILLASISILGSKDFTEEDKTSELRKPLKLSSLSEDYQIEFPFIEKEVVIKRNDSLFTILDNLGVVKEI
jgi:hypothetical protein